MLVVRTHVGPSPIHGMGLFADEFISKGSLVWMFDPVLDFVIDMKRLSTMHAAAKDFFQTYAYVSKNSGSHVLCMDNARFFNHSDNPNTANVSWINSTEPVDIAVRDILPGEELTTNYADFDLAFRSKLDGRDARQMRS